ncbi:MAG: homoserine kinase [Balneolaceae bacterium]|nr:homoserine kinase [Balneolaceae bacterium]
MPRYNLGEVTSVTPIESGFANENYRVVTARGKVLLRLVKQKSIQQLKYELNLLRYLQIQEFPTAYPIIRKDGEVITKEENKLIVLFDYLEGKEPAMNSETTGQVGAAIADLHNLSLWGHYKRPNDITIEKCLQLVKEFDSNDDTLKSVFEYFKTETRKLAEPLSAMVPIGIIHSDVFTDNTIFREDCLVGIIDFEEACVDKLLIDVGTTINGFCYPDNKLNFELLEVFLKRYQQKRLLMSIECELLPWYIRWGAHTQIYWHLRYGLLIKHNPRQLTRVQELIDRVEWAQNNMELISKRIKEII